MTVSLPSDILALDAADPLAKAREAFYLPEGVIYLDGNSLGPASKAALAALDRAASHEWRERLIRSWNEAGWFDLPNRAGDMLGRLIGAAPGETLVCDGTSINIYKMLHGALAMRPGRPDIVSEGESFPTDLYVAEGVASLTPGSRLRLEGVHAPTIEELIDARTGVVLANHVDYRTGRLRDMASLTARAHEAGALIIWDLCHTAGAMAVDLNGCGADFAVGCGYKYLNGGPGAPAFLWAAKRHHGALSHPLSGWWGHARPFAFERGYEGDPGLRAMLCGTQPILSMRALEGALSVFEGLDMAAVRAKGLSLTRLFIRLVEEGCARHGVRLATPREDHLRGSQVSFKHEGAYAAVQALIGRGVIGDFRAPDFMRFGFSPLYLSHADVWRAAEAMREVFDSGEWREARHQRRGAVT